MIDVIVIGIIAGMFKAMRDEIAHHWYKSTFRFIQDDFWREWFKSDWRRKDGKRFVNLYIMFFDGWHCGDFFQILFLMFAGFYIKDYVDFLRLFASFYLSFNLFYHILFVEK